MANWKPANCETAVKVSSLGARQPACADASVGFCISHAPLMRHDIGVHCSRQFCILVPMLVLRQLLPRRSLSASHSIISAWGIKEIRHQVRHQSSRHWYIKETRHQSSWHGCFKEMRQPPSRHWCIKERRHQSSRHRRIKEMKHLSSHHRCIRRVKGRKRTEGKVTRGHC